MKYSKKQRTKNKTELIEKYDKDTVIQSFLNLEKLSNSEVNAMKKIEDEIFKSLYKLITEEIEINSSLGKKIYHYHKKWLSFSIENISSSMHKEIVRLYVYDHRFSKYYVYRNINMSQSLLDIVHFFQNNNFKFSKF
ncbi:TipAS antibiotic-recognition domain-containing protein [Leuconostoc gelidum]|uniref:TipAS antibiotic-recognition domain-containing protein n=1 Tax=Leuconostoc gelidum TaxID=1244 RepID=UPI001C7D5031|nr:TipAS antibiotic-recognition domain-containing protein [Leuconostoc gelidum subsp. aenigmaticum]